MDKDLVIIKVDIAHLEQEKALQVMDDIARILDSFLQVLQVEGHCRNIEWKKKEDECP